MRNNPTIVIVVGEVSGDILGAGLIVVKSTLFRSLHWYRKQMLAQGCNLVDMEELSVMGLVEVVGHLPRLLKIRRSVIDYVATEARYFHCIDSPHFNLDIELK